MVAVVERNVSVSRPRMAAWLPLVCLPVAAAWLAAEQPPWIFMWTLAFSIYAGLKWLSFAGFFYPSRVTLGRSLSYLLLWPGMDAHAFCRTGRTIQLPTIYEWLMVFAKIAFGATLIVVAAAVVDRHPLIAGWIGMAGVLFTLHCGLFHLLSVLWRRMGVDAPPIMVNPIKAASLSEFWGRRWNLAFRDLAHNCVFRPLAGKLGIAGATLTVFLVSGLVHDVVISLPARGGYGLPTIYFVIQGAGLLFERSWIEKRIGTGNGAFGRIFCATVTLGPICLLFHQPFVERVVVPMFSEIVCLRS